VTFNGRQLLDVVITQQTKGQGSDCVLQVCSANTLHSCCYAFYVL